MKIKNREADVLLNNLIPILESKIVMPGIVTYYITRNVRMLSTALKEYIDYKNKVISDLGTAGENGIKCIRNDDKEAILKYENEMREIGNVEIEVDIIKISKEDLKGEYPASMIAAMYDIIE